MTKEGILRVRDARAAFTPGGRLIVGAKKNASTTPVVTSAVLALPPRSGVWKRGSG